MKASKLALSAILFLFFANGFAQTHQLITSLDPTLSENSGLVYNNGKLWTHNDSGNDSFLFSIDTLTGLVLNHKVVRNSVNVDWEDICSDEQYLYIGDFGNNAGTRDDLKIHRILLADLNDEYSDTVDSEIINFSYDPIYFSNAEKSNDTDFDCEAFICMNDSLYLFSKNWISKNCFLYSLPKEPGTYMANRRDTLDTQGLICGADYNPTTNTVCLIGYVYGIPAPSILFYLTEFTDDNFFNGTVIRHELSLSGYQTEGITFRDSNRVWFSNENFLGHTQSLYEFPTPQSFIQINNTSIFDIYPNPVEDFIYVKILNEEKLKYKIIDSSGNVIKMSCKKISPENEIKIDVSDLKSGDYIIEFYCNKKSICKNFVKL